MRTALLLLAATIAVAQVEDRSTEHRSFSGVRELVISNIQGGIDVTAWNGSSVEMDIEKVLSARTADRLSIGRSEVSLRERQEGGLVDVRVESDHHHGPQLYDFHYAFKVRVPRNISIELSEVNSSVHVEGTSGDFKVSSVNGEIEMRDVEGSGDVHTVNGKVKVTFARNPTGATSFKSVNGTLDVAFPASLNADVRVKVFNGSIWTDFAETAEPVSLPETRDGRQVWRNNRTAEVRIGSGGTQLSFETLNGQVLIRNREK
jgi:hypothetical protein